MYVALDYHTFVIIWEGIVLTRLLIWPAFELQGYELIF